MNWSSCVACRDGVAWTTVRSSPAPPARLSQAAWRRDRARLARQAYAERVDRTLQPDVASRGPRPLRVHQTARSPAHDQGLALPLQPPPPASVAGRPVAGRIRSGTIHVTLYFWVTRRNENASQKLQRRQQRPPLRALRARRWARQTVPSTSGPPGDSPQCPASRSPSRAAPSRAPAPPRRGFVVARAEPIVYRQPHAQAPLAMDSHPAGTPAASDSVPCGGA